MRDNLNTNLMQYELSWHQIAHIFYTSNIITEIQRMLSSDISDNKVIEITRN